jgi:hypothetical protein
MTIVPISTERVLPVGAVKISTVLEIGSCTLTVSLGRSVIEGGRRNYDSSEIWRSSLGGSLKIVSAGRLPCSIIKKYCTGQYSSVWGAMLGLPTIDIGIASCSLPCHN